MKVAVRDPQNLAVSGADVAVTAGGAQWSQAVRTNPQGEALLVAAPLGEYTVTV